VSRTVWVVFNALNFGGNAILVAQEIDQAVMVLVTTAFVASRDMPIVVAASMLKLGLEQCGVRRTFVQVITRNLHHATTAW
jgi:ribosomal protein L7Ae-like RNA K-turn-binding protein